MLPVIENLLILQDRDRKLMRIEAELANLGPEARAVEARAQHAQAEVDEARQKVKRLETDRKQLELDVEAKKTQIEKYAHQQFQTKKNEEYSALGKEIENCKAAISRLDDQQLELMEQSEAASRLMKDVAQATSAVLKEVEDARKALTDKEVRLRKELGELKADYDRLESAVDEDVRARYTRLRKSKGATAVVGITHSVCGGCHVKLPMQVVLSCQAQQELVTCPNCGRILYFTNEMDVAVAG